MTIYYGVCALHSGYITLQTHSEYVILIAFPRQQRLRERAQCYIISTTPVLFQVDIC
jgi:hypothetical protein